MGSKRKTGVEGVHIVKAQRLNAPLRWYIYAWRGGPKIRMQEGGEKPTLSAADVMAIAAAYEESKPINKGDLRSLIAAYRTIGNPDWDRLAPSTRKLWSDCLDVALTKWGDIPLRVWSNPLMVAKVVKWRDSMKDTPRAADNRIACLSRVLEYGRLRAQVTINVAAGIPTLYKGGNREEIIWTDEDFAKAEKSKKFTPALMDVIHVAAMSGFRRADLTAVDLAEVGEFVIRRTSLKKSAGKRRKVIVPIVPGMVETVETLKSRHRKPGVTKLLVNSFGEPWTPNGLNSSLYTAIRDADISYIDENGEKKYKHLHDLRGTFATHLMTLPGHRLTDQEIAEILGWSVESVAHIRRKYVDDAAIVVALGKRIANIDVKHGVKH